LASSDTAVDALFRQAGVTRVDTIREMLGVARILSTQPLPAGRRVAIVGNSGGPGIMAADACTTAGLELASFGEATTDALRNAVPAAGSVHNPVDVLGSGKEQQYAAALRAVLADEHVDAAIVLFTPTLVADPKAVQEAIAVAVARSPRDKPVIAAFLTSDDGVIEGPDGVRLPRFQAADEAVLALGRVADRASWLNRTAGTTPSFDDVDASAAKAIVNRALTRSPDGGWLDADDAVELLAAYGIPIVPTRTVTDLDGALTAAAELGYPVVLKAASGDVVHKTERGGVALHLEGAADVRGAWDAMGEVLTDRPRAVVQPMVMGGVETIAGVTNDATFGPLVLFGMGGTATELIGDRTVRLVPLSDLDASEMVRSLRTSPLLFGHRGAPPVDVEALESVLLRLSALADQHPEIAELDLNPVLASASGAVAVDAKILIRPAPEPPSAVRRLHA
jgi:acyl-CoA synthetase (NDP forming)